MVGGVTRPGATTIFSEQSLVEYPSENNPNCRFYPRLLFIPELTFPTAFFE